MRKSIVKPKFSNIYQKYKINYRGDQNAWQFHGDTKREINITYEKIKTEKIYPRGISYDKVFDTRKLLSCFECDFIENLRLQCPELKVLAFDYLNNISEGN